MKCEHLCCIALLLLTACVDTYLPKVNASGKSYLVVDGFINNGTASTTFRLSRSMELDESFVRPEQNAVLTIEGSKGCDIALTENGNGVYSVASLYLDNQEKYRLNIKTSDGKEFVSEYASVRETPAIDSLTWSVKGWGIEIYANTHDPLNATKYYQWDFDETWHYRTEFCTSIEYKNGKVSLMDPFIDIHNCWRTSKPNTNLLIATSEGLREDVISRFPITYVPAESEKLAVQYSILVKQRALSKSGYEYFKELRKNTEQLGSLFDPQPSDVSGNIVCVNDPDAVALGFVDVYTLKEQRIFIAKRQLPGSFVFPLRSFCYEFQIDSTDTYAQTLKGYYDNGIIVPINPPDSIPLVPTLLNIPYAPKACVDCRLVGTTIRPDFWPDSDTGIGCN